MLLYKYIDNNIIKVLEKCSLKFTRRNELNDPFELFPYFKLTDNNSDDIIDTIDEKEFQRLFLENLPEEAFQKMSPADWLAFEKNTRGQNPYKEEDPQNWQVNYFNDLVPKIMAQLNKEFVLLSLTEDPLNISMWTHYANNQKGFVIGFETDNDFFYEKRDINLEYRNVRKVEYVQQRPIIADIYNMDELSNTFFRKSTDWVLEKEWRILRMHDDADEIITDNNQEIVLFNFNPMIIKEIYFGLRSDNELRNNIFEIITNNNAFSNVKLYQIELDEKQFKLLPAKVTLPESEAENE